MNKDTLLHNRYLDQLLRWNRVHNLTAFQDWEQMNNELIRQSLLLEPYVYGRVADIGTGAGIPGIPLAIARPDLDFTLIDARAKKTTFVNHVIHSLGLENVTVLQQRVESCHLQPFDTIVSRALGSIAYISTITKHLRHSGTRLLCIRGRFEQSELTGQPLRMIASIPLSSDKQHNLVIMAS